MKNTKKDILFLCQYFYPEQNSSATLPFDTAKYLAARGMSVDALVGYPWEYTSERHLPCEETVEGVGIRRIRYLQLRRMRKLSRLVNYFSFTFGALMNASRLKRYRVVIVYSNPPVLPIVALYAKRRYGTRFVFVAYDVYPEVAYASRTLTPGSLISRCMRRINRALYREADCVVALTDEMRAFLLAQRPELTPDRVATIPNWAHEAPSIANHEAFARFGYRDGQFVISYIGNMGICQDVETMLEAAELLREDDRVRFLIAGHGSKKALVAQRIRERQLSNVQLLDFLEVEPFQQAVAISACCVVSLARGLMGMLAPSKYFTGLQVGHPVLAVVEEGSYLWQEVEQERIGRAVAIGDGAGLRDAILYMLEQPEERAEMSSRARQLYLDRYDYALAMEKYWAVMTEKCGLTKDIPDE